MKDAQGGDMRVGALGSLRVGSEDGQICVLSIVPCDMREESRKAEVAARVTSELLGHHRGHRLSCGTARLQKTMVLGTSPGSNLVL